MSEYRALKGIKIKTFATDLSNAAAEGQVFFSTASNFNALKTVVASAAWSAGGSLINAHQETSAAGTQTAGLCFAGAPPTGGIVSTEEYNGSGWAVGGDLNTARRAAATFSASTQTASLIFGGSIAPNPTVSNATEEYNGTSWTSVNNLPAVKYIHGGAGIQTAALAFGGYNGTAAVATTEEYDGTNWTAGNAMSTARYSLGSAGLQTAALAFGGTPPVTAATEEYDGTNWSAGGSMNTARRYAAGCGIQTSALVFGAGPSAVVKTELYDGTSWTEIADMAVAQKNHGGAGTTTAGLSCGGESPSNTRHITQEFNRTVNTVTGGAWGAGGNMNTNRGENFMLAGTIGAAVAAGGFNPSVPGATANSEEYNGTSWTEGNNLNTARWDHSAAGTQTACVFGGGNTALTKAEQYNGTSWSEGGDMNTGGRARTSGVLTAAIIAGRKDVPGGNITVNCESYDGSSWTEIANLSTARGATQQVGGPSAALSASGTQDGVGGVVNVANVESWDGTSWTEVANVLDDSRSGQGAGDYDDMMLINGTGATANGTQIWNGTSWVSGVATPYSSTGGGANGASTAVLNAGGSGDVNGSIEFTGETTALNIKTLTDS